MQPVSTSVWEVVHSVKNPGGRRLRWRRASASLRGGGLGAWLALCLGLAGCDDSGPPMGSVVSPNPDFFFEPEVSFSGSTEWLPVAPNPEPFAVCDEQGGLELMADALPVSVSPGFGRVVYAWIPDAVARALTPTAPPFGEPSNWAIALQQAAPRGSAALLDAYPELAMSAGLVTWPNPWATRLLFEGAEQPRLLKLTLRDGLSWLSFVDGEPKVIDASGIVVDMPLAPADQGLVAGIAVLMSEPGEAGCHEPRRRTVIVTNPDAIVEWSIGDAASLSRVTTDASNVEALMRSLRSCSPTDDASAWVSATACSQYAGSDGHVGAFERGLALATPDYYPETVRLAHLADTLRADLRAWSAAPLLLKNTEGQTTEQLDVDAGGVDSGVELEGGVWVDVEAGTATNDVVTGVYDGGTDGVVTAATDATPETTQVTHSDVGDSGADASVSVDEASSSAGGTREGDSL